jgi:hypothetical protein
LAGDARYFFPILIRLSPSWTTTSRAGSSYAWAHMQIKEKRTKDKIKAKDFSGISIFIQALSLSSLFQFKPVNLTQGFKAY